MKHSWNVILNPQPISNESCLIFHVTHQQNSIIGFSPILSIVMKHINYSVKEREIFFLLEMKCGTFTF